MARSAKFQLDQGSLANLRAFGFKFGMGRVRRGGYIIKWFIGDHAPRHVHVDREGGELVGRFGEELAKFEQWVIRKVVQKDHTRTLACEWS